MSNPDLKKPDAWLVTDKDGNKSVSLSRAAFSDDDISEFELTFAPLFLGPVVKALEWMSGIYCVQTANHPFGTYSCPKFHDQWDLLIDGRHFILKFTGSSRRILRLKPPKQPHRKILTVASSRLSTHASAKCGGDSLGVGRAWR